MYTDYKIVFGATLQGLEEKVRALMLKGWQPIGGVTVASPSFVQAMARVGSTSR